VKGHAMLRVSIEHMSAIRFYFILNENGINRRSKVCVGSKHSIHGVVWLVASNRERRVYSCTPGETKEAQYDQRTSKCEVLTVGPAGPCPIHSGTCAFNGGKDGQ